MEKLNISTMKPPYFTKLIWVIRNIKKEEINPKYEQRKKGSKVEELKLFLCSRDIKVGDLVYSIHALDLPWIACEKEPLKGDFQWGFMKDVHPEFSFKIIGEVSPNATWVKEGMEFEESEVEHGGWFDEELKRMLIKFKCPKCGTFH